MPTFGYAGKILRVDLSSGKIVEISTLDYVDRFLGGRGIAAKVYWDEVLPEVSAFDAENKLIFATGPLCGLPAIAGSRWQVCGKGLAFQGMLHTESIKLFISLCPQRLNCWALSRVQHPYLDKSLINIPSHLTTQSVDLSNHMTLGWSPDGRVTGHQGYIIQVHGE